MLLLDIFSKLNQKQSDYLVIGGVALVMHGVVRMTADLDLMVALDRENLQKFIEAMAELGYRPRVPEPPAALLDPEKRRSWHEERNMEVFSFYNPTQSLALVDVFIHEPIDYRQARSKAILMTVGTERVPVASIDDLIALKKLSSRPQDLEDIKALQEKRHE